MFGTTLQPKTLKRGQIAVALILVMLPLLGLRRLGFGLWCSASLLFPNGLRGGRCSVTVLLRDE